MASTMPVTGPVAQKYQFGLQSVASVVDTVDEHEFLDGVTFQADCTLAMSELGAGFCDENSGKVLAAPNIFWVATPFRGYNGLFCKLPGMPELLTRAEGVFELGEWQFLEHNVWTGDAGGTPFLSAPGGSPAQAADITPTPGTAVSMQEGVGLLDAWLADNLGVIGVVWSPRKLAGWWMSKGLARIQGPQMLDPVGNPIALMARAPYLGPNNAAEVAGKYWLYGTGPAMIRRSQKFIPVLEQALDRKENEVFGIVERSYLFLLACTRAAVLVDPLLPAGV